MKQLIDDRNVAKALFGKGSLEEQTLKTGVNSGRYSPVLEEG
ncbi:MAG: hypothetical protein Q4E05_12135 [Pseudoclavibacter sp.]|nr:hypothetical protein [Pseudoclavibacter sp.]